MDLMTYRTMSGYSITILAYTIFILELKEPFYPVQDNTTAAYNTPLLRQFLVPASAPRLV